MTKIEAIRKTFVPPVVATIIAIGLVSDWTTAGTNDSTVAPENAPQSVTQPGNYIRATNKPGSVTGNAALVRLVYRLPVSARSHDQYTQTLFLHQAYTPVQTWQM